MKLRMLFLLFAMVLVAGCQVKAAEVNQVLAAPATCASEDYTGTKLLWCQKICESGLTGAAQQAWIHRWINRYRDLPYCLIESE